MISKADRVYYIDPIQPPEVTKTLVDGTPLELQIVPTRYRRENFNLDKLGTVIDVQHQRLDAQELWWVDATGDYVYGAQLVDRIRGRGTLMAIVNDDLFYVGRNGGEHHLGASTRGSILADARRSDGKRFTTGTMTSYVSRRVLKAAPWAHELMPVPGDNETVVAAKVARAKQLFTQRQKKGEIYKEGMKRDWLHHLETLRPTHDMPRPTFRVGVEGLYLASGRDPVEISTLTQSQQERLSPISDRTAVRPNGGPRDGYATTFAGAHFAVVTGLEASDQSALMSTSTYDIRYAVFDKLRIHSGHILENTRFAVLTDF
jgi:hypothetical protein